jgi:hypothetical protein
LLLLCRILISYWRVRPQTFFLLFGLNGERQSSIQLITVSLFVLQLCISKFSWLCWLVLVGIICFFLKRQNIINRRARARSTNKLGWKKNTNKGKSVANQSPGSNKNPLKTTLTETVRIQTKALNKWNSYDPINRKKTPPRRTIMRLTYTSETYTTCIPLPQYPRGKNNPANLRERAGRNHSQNSSLP